MIGRLRSWWSRGRTARGENPDREVPGDPERVRSVQAVLAELRPAFRADGGDLVLQAVLEDGTVRVSARGNCHGCGASVLTLQGALAPRLRERCPWFRRIELAG